MLTLAYYVPCEVCQLSVFLPFVRETLNFSAQAFHCTCFKHHETGGGKGNLALKNYKLCYVSPKPKDAKNQFTARLHTTYFLPTFNLTFEPGGAELIETPSSLVTSKP